MGRRHDLLPEHTRLHDIALFHRADLVAARTRQVESHTGNTLNLERVVDLRVDATFLPVAEIDDLLGFTEVNAACQLPNDEYVETFNHLFPQGRRFGQRRVA